MAFVGGCLWGKTFWVTREHGRLADVVEAQVQHRDSLHANTSAGVGRSSIAE